VPSPVGHTIAGAAAGWLVAGTPRDAEWRQQGLREAALFGALGALPDIDLLFGAHSGPTHSIGAVLIVGAVAWLLAVRTSAPRPTHLTVACMLAYGSHVLLDWLARDTTPPIGIMALWPFSRGFYESDLHLFMAISRRYFQGWAFVRQNVLAVTTELAILTPLLGLVMFYRRRRRVG